MGRPKIFEKCTLTYWILYIFFLKAVSSFLVTKKQLRASWCSLGGRHRMSLSLGSVDNQKIKNVSWRFRLCFHIKWYYGPLKYKNVIRDSSLSSLLPFSVSSAHTWVEKALNRLLCTISGLDLLFIGDLSRFYDLYFDERCQSDSKGA